MHWTPTLPPFAELVWLAPAVVAWVSGAAWLSAWLRTTRGWRDGDTRKVFHFAVFTAAAVLYVLRDVRSVNVLGGVTALLVLFAVWRGEGFAFYEALARQKDRPQRSFYVLLPLAATAAGGIASTALFGDAAVFGFVASGWGDAVAEPIGIRFGRHEYRVPAFGRGVRSTRSFEGSAAVFTACLLGSTALFCAGGLGAEASLGTQAGTAFAIAAACCLVEAISPHGLDNLTLQVTGSAVAAALLG